MVSLATGSPFGSSQCRLASALLRCLGFGVCLYLSSWVSERLSVAFRPVFFGVFFLSLFLYGSASFLVVTSDSFGTRVSLHDVVDLWDESGFAWTLVPFQVSGFPSCGGLPLFCVWFSFSPLTLLHRRFP